MKIRHYTAFLVIFMLVSCKKGNRWQIEKPKEEIKLVFENFSNDFFDPKQPLESLQKKYYFFFDYSVSDATWEKQRKNQLELAVYKSTMEVFKDEKYKEELNNLFTYYKHYFPEALLPTVYTYSSGLLNIYEPVVYGSNEGILAIALDGFLGSDSKWYAQEGVYPYLSKRMTPEDIAPKVARSIGSEIVPLNPRDLSFINLMIDEGKKLILADALLPNTSDELKIGYTQDELEWVKANEGHIWNYFVEQNLIFNSDKSNKERFLEPAPFSKFHNEIETFSPGQVGVWIGWQICRKFMNENPKISLQEFFSMGGQEIFKDSKYKPKKEGNTYTSPQKSVDDESDSSL